jgi:gluconolactonase
MNRVSGVWDVTTGLQSEPLRDLSEFVSTTDGLDHPEGVAVGPNGTLYAGGEAGQIYRIGADGSAQQYASIDGFALGLALDADSNAYVCETTGRTVRRVTPEGAVSIYTSGLPNRAFVNPNYPAFDAAGNLYVSDSGQWNRRDGCILVVRPGGATELWSDEVTAFPNGLCLGPDGKWLYVVVSEMPGIVRVAIEDDGSAGLVETVVELPKNVPDGIAFDQDGTLFIACYAPSVVYQFTTDGVLQVLGYDWQNTQLAAPTNIAFTGPNRTRMVIGSLSRWHLTSIEMTVPGLPLHFPSLPR